MIVTTTELFRQAYGKYALGAYNINNLEQTVGLFRGNLGKEAKNEEPTNPAQSAPFIIQISRGARGYSDKRFLEAMIRTAEEVFPDAIFAVHLDHGTEEVCYDCIESGFYSSVMIDASHEPLPKNIEITRRVVDRAHAKGIVVEAELGQLGGVEEDVTGSVLSDRRQEAVEFVAKSGCDSLAVAIGTSHGAYKFGGAQALQLDRLTEIQAALPRASPGDARLQQRAQGVGRSDQRRRRQDEGHQRRERRPVSPRRQARRLQDQHRHRRPPGLVRHPPRVLPRPARISTSAPPARSS